MDQLLRTYRVFSEEMRLRIVMLLTHGELCVCDMEVLGEAQSKVSRHLAYLKHSGLVKSRRAGVWMHYSLNDPLDEIAVAHIRSLAEHTDTIPVFQEDIKKMEDVKRRKLCGSSHPMLPVKNNTPGGGFNERQIH
ncbi:MAG: metalloregulator ArsR/SmtB family transcription factor [Syntrophorhabdaceae bacterium]|nr:metalloregulator ArsR/SmtB family transcription factor [Syntrophorhabdaceae bacterium]MDD4197124.1 metalloregulator ArsR/SmtB family transcription factor [Syntrophorhabdaceae bacterium]